MILPHDVQLGAGAKRGCKVALQLHFRALEVERVGFVESSSAAMAEVRSEIELVVVVSLLLGWRRGDEVPDAGREIDG